MSKHTPGPWNVMENGFGMTHNVPTVYATDDELRFIAFCEDRINMVPTPNIANARLIAAAPELLEALKMADAALSGANMNMKVVQRKVTEAIAKAEGKQ